MAPSLSYSASHAIAGTTITVDGTGFTASDTISAFTVGGVTPTNTIVSTVVGFAGTWTGTFVVPDLAAGAKAVVVTDTDDGAVSGPSFTIDPSVDVDPSGAATHSASAVSSVTASSFSTTVSPDVIIAAVAWEDTGGASVSSVSDTTVGGPLAWTPRGQKVQYGSFFLQEWSAVASAVISSKTVTAHFSGTISGHAAIVVFGVAYSKLLFDTNPGLASGYNASVTSGTSIASSITTHLAPEYLLASILLAPAATITSASGWSQIAAVNATDFELQVQGQRVASIVTGFATGGSFASSTYTASLVADAIQESDATDNPYTQKYKQALIDKDGLITQGYAPQLTNSVSVSGNTTTYDYSNGAASTVTEAHTSQQNPQSAPSSNESDA